MLTLHQTLALIAEELKLYGGLVRSTLVYLKPVSGDELVMVSTAGDLADYLVTLHKEVTEEGQHALEYRLQVFARMPDNTTVQKHTKIKQKAILEHLLHGDVLKIDSLQVLECGASNTVNVWTHV
jgi:hypothetical protein